MPSFSASIPLALYIHLPWCVRKCPYCDFNSHALRQPLPETEYINALLCDLAQDLSYVQSRCVHSIFFGGGTPSLFSPQALDKLLQAIYKLLPIAADAEITLEANPGTIEQQRFSGYKAAGINRLSIGIQSFQDSKLKALGRIHGRQEAVNAVAIAKQAGFSNFNLDLMFGLPEQTMEDAQFDLATAVALEPTHISWYQLTLEPNTLFYRQPPKLPEEDTCWLIQEMGQDFLAKNHYLNYEVSAYSQMEYQCRHNLNYWQFGDYLGIGAGAHAKITEPNLQQIKRFSKLKHPKDYLAASHYIQEIHTVAAAELPFEFLINALRLQQPITRELFEQRTGLAYQVLEPKLHAAAERELLIWDKQRIKVTEQGRRFLNDLTALFLP